MNEAAYYYEPRKSAQKLLFHFALEFHMQKPNHSSNTTFKELLMSLPLSPIYAMKLNQSHLISVENQLPYLIKITELQFNLSWRFGGHLYQIQVKAQLNSKSEIAEVFVQ